MSGLLTIAQLSSGRGSRLVGRFLLCAFLSAMTSVPAKAGALDWLAQTTSRNSRSVAQAKTPNVKVESVQVQPSADEARQISGGNLDTFNFAQSHWTQSRARLEKACRAISSRYNDPAARDILQKLFVIDTQIYRENIRNAAMAVSEVRDININVRQGLVAINRIVTAPGQETLDNLDKAIDGVLAANVNQMLLVKKHLSGAEKTVQISQAAYETLELIPSLSFQALDMLVQTSKQLMRIAQSNSEAFKGLLLNVQSSNEQVTAGLDNIKKTVRETLRFSDHFAVKQFPLINLPTPSREKIFVQLNTLSNFVRGVDNTVQIGDSQVRNSSQQFTHIITGFIAKADESLKYYNPDNQEKALEQISTYARNQVSGLFLRAKEDIAAMRTVMAKAARPTSGNMPPAVNIESRDEYASRRARTATSEKLPLFLLGGGKAVSESERVSGTASNEQMITATVSQPDSFLPLVSTDARSNGAASTVVSRNASRPPAGATEQVLYNENMSFGDDSELLQSEVSILSKELGTDFFFGSGAGGGDNISGSRLMAQNDDSVGFAEDEEQGEDQGYAEGRDYEESSMQISCDNLNGSGEPEIELLKFDSASNGSSADDLIPMMRFDSDTLSFDE
ncbi:MAG: hypothetical protein KKB51_06100 [Candidatus Riflebacteria bacterium]|nr:hypothetical protein [Candidatus Riflebacteria bacterium]